VEYEEVYADRFYGTLKSQVESQLERGDNVVFDVDVNGAMDIKAAYGDEALALFIQPPSIEELRRRLTNRGTETPDVIETRIERAAYEMSQAERFDRIVVNDDLDTAEKETLEIIKGFIG
jgi:guanylate kinase